MHFDKIASPLLKGTLGSLRKHFGGFQSLSPKVRRGLERKGKEHPMPDSLFLWPVAGLGRLAVGKTRRDDALWKYLRKPALSADIAGGRAAQKVPGMKRLFTQRDQIPVGRRGKKLFEEIERPALSAPLDKARGFAAPLAIGFGGERLLDKSRQRKTDGTDWQ